MTALPIANGTLIAFNADTASQLASILEEGPFNLWYIGDNFRERLTLETIAPSDAHMGDFHHHLEDAAGEMHDDIINLDAQVLKNPKDNLAWHASQVSNPVPWAGSLPHLVALYLAMKAILDGGGRHVFVTNAPRAGSLLAETGRMNGLAMDWRGPETKAPGIVSGLRARVSSVVIHFVHALVTAGSRWRPPVDWPGLRTCDVLLVDWAGSDTFQENGPTEKTWNLGTLAGLLRDGDASIGFVANPLSWRFPFPDIVRNIVQAKDPVLLAKESFRLRDVLIACWESWRLPSRLNLRVRVSGQIITPLLKHALTLDRRSKVPIMARSYDAIARLLAEKNVNPRAVAFTFENQGWERVMISGFRRYLPDTKLIGIQHAPFAKGNLGFYISDQELNTGISPDTVVFMGEVYKDWFIKRGFPEARSKLGGSVRFDEGLSGKRQPNHRNLESTTLLCTLPLDLQESMDIVRKTLMATGEMGNVTTVISYHPATAPGDLEQIKSAVYEVADAFRDRVRFSTESSRSLMEKADVMVYNSSGTIFDAMIVGIPAIYLPIEGVISMNKVLDTEVVVCSSTEELKMEIRKVMGASEASHPDTINISRYLTPLNERAIRNAILG